MFPWLLSAGLLIALLAALCKVRLLHDAMDELAQKLPERLHGDTNAALTVYSRDSHALALASQLDRALRELRRRELRVANGDRELKMAAAGVAHDLRTPLTAMLGYLELLRREALTPNAERYAAVLEERARLMRQLTGELFTWSVSLADTRENSAETVSVNALLEDSVAAFYSQLTERGIEPEILMPDAPVTRTLDKTALTRIFSNLLSNAVKYSAGDLRIVLSEDGEVSFINSAPVLTPVELSRLFDRFYTVETASNSTGLGLSIAKALSQALGASLTASLSGGRLTVKLSI